MNANDCETARPAPTDVRRDWFEDWEKPDQLSLPALEDGGPLTAFGISIGVRNGSADMLVEQLHFTKLLAQLGVAHYVKSVWFCHNAWIHGITSLGDLCNEVRELIEDAAEQTLCQATLDNGRVLQRNDLQEAERLVGAGSTPSSPQLRRFAREDFFRGQDHALLRDAANGIRPDRSREEQARLDHCRVMTSEQGRLLCPHCGADHVFLFENFFFGFDTGGSSEPLMLSGFGCSDCRGSFVMWTLTSGEGGYIQGWEPRAHLEVLL